MRWAATDSTRWGRAVPARRASDGHGPDGWGRGLRGALADPGSQGGDLTAAANAVPQVVPEVHPQLAASFLQSRERLPAAAAFVTAGAAADLALLDVLADVSLRGVVVQRHLRPLQNAQQVGAVVAHLPEHAVDARVAGLLAAQGVEAGFQERPLRR